VYYSDKTQSLKDIFGTPLVSVEPGCVRVGARSFPVIDDVIILLEPSRRPAGLAAKIAAAPSATGAPTVQAPRSADFAGDIQFTFGEEWQRFPAILPEHEQEFALYFDLVDLPSLAQARVCDLGCGIGRWSYHLAGQCRELVLVDFSEAIFVARRNLAGAPGTLFFMGDLKQLPFRDGFADFLFSLGVLHHLPTPALDEVRALARLAPTLLIFLYYALDNRPRVWRFALALVTRLRLAAAGVRNRQARSLITGAALVLLYLPLIGLGRALRPVGLARYVPLYEFYHDKSFPRIRQDVYDRFFTRIEQRYRRDEILALRDCFREVTVSEQLPYWHFLCRS
jgi:SAM-dependent methyltransferase